MLKDISNYSLSTIFSSLMALLLLPFFTRYLSPEDFGILAIYSMFGGITANLLSLGLQTATIRYYYKEKNNLSYFGKLNFTNLLFILFMFFIGGMILFFNIDEIANYMFSNQISENILMLSFIGGCLASLYNYFHQLLIPQQRSRIFAIVNILSVIIISGTAILFILIYSMTYYARIFGYLINYTIMLFILFFLQRNYFNFNLSKSTLKRSIKYSYPQIPSEIISLAHESFDKTMLTNIKGLGPVGNYQIAQRIGGVCKTFTQTISRAWVPFFMHNAEKNTLEAKQKIAERYFEVVMIYNYFCFTICLFSEDIIKILTTKAFYPSMYILPLVVLYILFAHTLSSLSKPQVVFAEKLVYTIPSSALGLVTNIVLNIILIPKFGALGAVIATLIAGIFSGLLLSYFGQRLYPLPIKYHKLMGQLTLFISFLIPIYFLMYSEIFFVTKFIIKLMILTIYILLTFQFKFLEYKRIKSMLYNVQLIIFKKN